MGTSALCLYLSTTFGEPMDKNWIPALLVVISLMIFGAKVQKQQYEYQLAVLDRAQQVNIAGNCVKVKP